jgi:hypothetical protein
MRVAIYGVRYRILDSGEELTEWFCTLAARDLALEAARAHRGPNRSYPYGVIRSPIQNDRKAV